MEKIYKPKEVKEMLQISQQTIINWEKSGKLVAKRLPSGRRYFLQSQIDSLLNIDNKKEYTISKDISSKELSELLKELIDGNVNKLIVKGDIDYEKMIMKLFSNYDIEIVSI